MRTHAMSRSETRALPAPPKLILQRKLAVAAPGGTLEREADRVADGVAGAATHRDRATAAGDELLPVTAPPIVHDVIGSPGRPLDAATRAALEPRLGHDFSAVRVHTDARAARSAEAVGAQAYTVGAHIAFRGGAYRPQTADGKRLLAHELTHVVQQSQAGAAPHLSRQPIDDPKKKAGAPERRGLPDAASLHKAGMDQARREVFGHHGQSNVPSTTTQLKWAIVHKQLPQQYQVDLHFLPPEKQSELGKLLDKVSADELARQPESIDETAHPKMSEVHGGTIVKALANKEGGKIGLGASVATPLSSLLLEIIGILRKH